jgi:hypothetical protein
MVYKKKVHKNPKARSAAAKRMLQMSLKKKAMMKGGLKGDGEGTSDSSKVPPLNSGVSDSGNPGSDMT